MFKRPEILKIFPEGYQAPPRVENQHVRARASAYDAAGRGRRATGWDGVEMGINSIHWSNADILRKRARDQVRKNHWAANAVESLTANAVGTGIQLKSQHPDPKIREQIHKAWERWNNEADADGRTDFCGLQALACRSMIEGGECFLRFRSRYPEDGLSVPLQLQLMESEQLPFYQNSYASQGNNTVRSGIEFTPFGKRVAYHLWKQHPGEFSFFGSDSNTITRVPAVEILHLYRALRPGQIRGETWLAPVLVKLFELGKYDDAELLRKQVAAALTGFITSMPADDSALNSDGSATDTTDAVNVNLQPGSFIDLNPGEDVKIAPAADVGGMYGEFMACQLRAVAAGLGLTYAQLSGDLSGSSYSADRSGQLEFRRRMEQFQYTTLVFQMCLPVYVRWMDEAVIAGALKLPSYREKRAEYQDCSWITPGWPWVDPLKDINAAVVAIRNGITSRSRVVTDRGEQIERIDAEIAADNQRAEDLDITLDSNPAQVDKLGKDQPPDPAEIPPANGKTKAGYIVQ